MKTNNKLNILPRLYQLTYYTEEYGSPCFTLFIKFGDAVDFLKYLSTKNVYLFGQIVAFKRIPDSCGAIDSEDEVLFQIYKNGDYIAKK